LLIACFKNTAFYLFFARFFIKLSKIAPQKGRQHRMKLKTERVFNYPCDIVCKQLMDSEDGGYDMAELENVTQWKVLKEQDDGTKRIGVKEWCAHGQIPKALQSIISPKMLTWLEHSEWNRQTTTYSFRIEPHFLKNQISCEGRTVFSEKGKDKCSRTFNIELKVKIPVLGALLEAMVLDYLKKNEEQDFNMCVKSIDKVYKK